MRLTRTFLVALCLLGASLLLAAGASARTVELHTFSSSFDGHDMVGASGPFGYGSLEKLAIDKANGDVLVAGQSQIAKFGPDGTAQPFSALAPNTVIAAGIGSANAAGFAVDNGGGATQGRIYAYPEANPANAYEPSGTLVTAGFPLPAEGDECGAAVDAQGHFWRKFYGGGASLREYNPDGTPTGTTVELEGGSSICGFEMDAAGNFYAPASYAGGPIDKFSPSGAFLGQIDGANSATLAIDRSTGDIYVDAFTRIDHFNAAGQFVESFGTLTESSGVAVNPTTHAVYATTYGATPSVQIFTAAGPIQVPETWTEPATEIGRGGAKLNGKLDPEGIATVDCRFEYGTVASGSFTQSAPCAEGNVFTGSSETPVTATLSGIESETEYQYRLRVENGNGPSYGTVALFTTFGAVKETETGEATGISATEATLHGSLDPDGIETHYWFEYGTGFEFQFNAPLPVPPGADAGNGSGTTPLSVTLTGLSPGTSAQGAEFQYRLVAENSFGVTKGEVRTFRTLPAVKGVKTLAATEVGLTDAKLNGSFEPQGKIVHYYFQWGINAAYGKYAPVPPPGVEGAGSSGVEAVSATLTGLEIGATYHYRVVAVGTNGTTYGTDKNFKTGGKPTIAGDRATEINTDTTALEGTINPNARPTTYHWEYGTEDCASSTCTQTEPLSLGEGNTPVPVRFVLEGLTPGATYHFRLVAENSFGTTEGDDHFFITFQAESGVEECPNVLERQQTGAGATPHCRAYELVSAANTGGYDVESNLIAGLHPMPGFPEADGKVLYSVRFGVIPGSGNPPNRGGDPYVATRGADGWTTEYVGLQANGTPSTHPFSSTLAEADRHLDSFAFGGPEICAPCFPDGSRNMPLRLPGGALVKGMAGSENPPGEPAGEIAKRFSGDGHSFVFGSTSRFEPNGNEGSLSIYERNLSAGSTQVVSTEPDGSTMPGAGIAELDLSEDGSRVLVGRKVGEDAAGTPLYDLFMHIGTDPHSVLVAAPLHGVHYAGMTADGSKVYFTTVDPLGSDSDASADLFRADVGPGGATITRVSTGAGGTGDTNSCNPVGNAGGNHWNEPGSASAATCSVVAIAGGGGVAAGSGTVYFLSPEQLDPAGTADQPNLYVARPGSAPAFVATLDAEDSIVRDAVAAATRRETADFQTTPDGTFAVFDSRRPQVEANTAGHTEIYRSQVGAPIACVSCIPSNGAPITDTKLTAQALNLTEDGRVLFTSAEQLVLRDTNQLDDVYEWDAGRTGIVSTGLDINDSGLLTASEDGTDVFFFTRQTLAPQDENGGAMKIYDAREDGGFLYNPPPAPCRASDECHGAGTQQGVPPAINTLEGTGKPQPTPGGGKPAKCRKGTVKSHGKCVKKPAKKQHKKKGHGNRRSTGKDRHNG